MITFALGGFGGAINAAYAMNAMIHNTAWVQGHFHLTVGTAVALSFMGFSYWMLPRSPAARSCGCASRWCSRTCGSSACSSSASRTTSPA